MSAPEVRRVPVAAVDPREAATFALEVDGRTAGVAAVARDPGDHARHAATLSEVRVDPQFQGRGWGRALIEAAAAWADEVGVERLQVQVPADAAGAVHLFRATGFAEESRRSAYYRRPDGSVTDELGLVRLARPIQFQKVAAALIRGDELCVFGHPTAGWQLPKGTLEPGEEPRDAVLREVDEETGLTGVRIERALGSWVQASRFQTVERWYAYRLVPPAGTPDRWDHVARGSPEEDGLVFALRWIPLRIALEVLPPQFHEVIHRALSAR